MEMVKYLKDNYREPTPEWLKTYQKGQPLPLRDFLHSRIGYYPGCGDDGHLFRVFGKSHSVHCFVLVDYMVSEEAVLKSIHKPDGIRGYGIVEERSVSEQEMKSVAPFRKWHITEGERPHGEVGTVTPFVRFVALERLPDFDDEHGAERLAVLFMGADAIATYDAIFANGNARPPFVVLAEDYGFGGQWAAGFAGGQLLENIAQRSGVYPEFLLAPHSPWSGYEKVEGVARSPGGAHDGYRNLYKRKDAS